jgi:hypothetical protein
LKGDLGSSLKAPVCTLESVWFQPLNLSCDLRVSKRVNLYRCAEDGVSASTYGTTRDIPFDENPIYALRAFTTMTQRDRNQLHVSKWTDSESGRTGWEVRFQNSPRFGQRNVLTVMGGRLTCATACGATSSRAVEGSAPLGGTFTINVPFPNGTTAATLPLAFDAADGVVTAAIDRLYGRPVAYDDKSAGYCRLGCTWEVTFHGGGSAR